MPPTDVTRTPSHTLDRAGPGEDAEGLRRGDFVLVAGTHLNSRLIRFGQKLRVRSGDRGYAEWTHAALVVDPDGTLIEAVGTGVQRSHLDHYRDEEYVTVHVRTSEENRGEVVDFAERALSDGARYNRLQIVSIALSLLTGSRLTFFIDGQYVCSGLVAAALERTGAYFGRNAALIAPADLARYFKADEARAHRCARTAA